MPNPRRRSVTEPLILLALTAAALIASGIHPYDRTTWFLEVAPEPDDEEDQRAPRA